MRRGPIAQSQICTMRRLGAIGISLGSMATHSSFRPVTDTCQDWPEESEQALGMRGSEHSSPCLLTASNFKVHNYLNPSRAHKLLARTRGHLND